MTDGSEEHWSRRLSDVFRNGRNDLAGALLFAVGAIALMGIITAEVLYPGYSTADNMISDLGATEPPDSVIEQPSSNIFSGSMIVCGSLILIALAMLEEGFRRRSFRVPLGLFGVGVLGVGVFNGSWGDIHALFALTTFVAGGVAAVMSFRVLEPPMGYMSVLLGAIGLSTLAIYFATGEDGILGALGPGGIERWVAYPILLWTMGFGGYLTGRASKAG